MADFYTFGRDATRDIVDAVRRVKNTPLTHDRWENSDPAAVVFRIGKTTTNADYPTYPTSGDTFVVELGELSFTEATGTQTNTWTAYSPQDTRIAHDVTGTYWDQNTYVQLALHHGRWFIIAGATSVVLACRVTNAGSIENANVLECETGTVTHNGTAPAVARYAAGFTADSPQNLITVHDFAGPPAFVGDRLLVTQVNGKYWILRGTHNKRYKAKPRTTHNAGTTAIYDIYQNQAITSKAVTVMWNYMMSSTPIPAQTDCIIEWFDDEARWVVVQAACPT